MKALTIKQPWATLIAEGYKTYEFRTWKTKYRGRFLIHAGLGVDKEAMKRFEHLNLKYPQGKIIAECELEDCVLITKDLARKLNEKDDKVYKNLLKLDFDNKDVRSTYGFKLKNVKKIKEIDAKGKLSFWDIDL